MNDHPQSVRSSATKEYFAWRNAKRRCDSPNIKDYHNRNGENITMCSKWINSFSSFISDMGLRPDGAVLSRLNELKGYTPENCAWLSCRADEQGKRYGRLLVGAYVNGKYSCACQCGKVVLVDGSALRSGKSTSCGCRKLELLLKHGHSRTGRRSKEYAAWQDAKNRCYNPKTHSFGYCGARGIKMCDRWLHSFHDFLSDMGPSPQGFLLDRKDNDGNYDPSNCRWVSAKVSANNKRFHGKDRSKNEAHKTE